MVFFPLPAKIGDKIFRTTTHNLSRGYRAGITSFFFLFLHKHKIQEVIERLHAFSAHSLPRNPIYDRRLRDKRKIGIPQCPPSILYLRKQQLYKIISAKFGDEEGKTERGLIRSTGNVRKISIIPPFYS